MFDFADNRVVKTIDKIPEEFRPLYEETAGEEEGEKVFTLKGTDDTKAAVAALTGANKALKAARAEAKALKSKTVDITPLRDLGVEGESIEEISAGLKARFDELQDQVKGGKEAKVNIEKMKADIAKGHATEMEAKNKRTSALESQLYNVLVRNEALSALGDSGALDADLVMPFVEKKLKTVEEDGQFKVVVIDEVGDRKYSGTTGEEMTIKELVKDMKADPKYAPLFKSEQKKGSGTTPGGAARVNPIRTQDTDKKHSVSKIADGLRARSGK